MGESLNDVTTRAVREAIRRRVVSLRNRQRAALVVFTGAKIGCVEAVDSLSKLRGTGYQFKVLLSSAAAETLDVDAIDRLLLPEEMWVARSPVPPEVLARDAGIIIVPTLTANTCAHVISLQTDTYAQRAIVEGLMLGRSVVCAIDGCCPDNAHRIELGFNPQEALAQRMRDNRDALRSYGVTPTIAARIGDKVLSVQERELRVALGLEPANEVAFVGAPRTSAPVFGKVLGAGFVRSLAPGSRIEVPAGAIVTQLAREVARASDISLIEPIR